MEQVSGTKKETSANWPLNTNTPTKEKFVMTTVSAPARNPYATEANPTLQRHHWQNLFGLIASIRPEWPFDGIVETVFGCRNLQPFPELAATAIRTAQTPRFNGPGAIRLVITELIEP
jgi:hypothetical protein